MNALQYTVPFSVDPGYSLPCWSAPGQEDDSSGADFGHYIQTLLREPLPAFALMAVGSVDTDSQARVQHQDTPLGPGSQETTLLFGSLERGIVILQRNVDVREGRGGRRGWANRKAKAVGLVVVMVWVLADYDGLDGVQGSMARPER